MPRPPRQDHPGADFHLFARAIARRPLFESRADVRFFLSLIARAVRRGLIEVYAYCVLTTHFHILVRSSAGRLSEAMQFILNRYSRRFNRTRRRDGPNFRSRFGSRRVESTTHWRNVVRYIDLNPVDARVVSDPTRYPYCSAYWYSRSVRPPWLSCARVESLVNEVTGNASCSPSDYPVLHSGISAEVARSLVERRCARDVRCSDALDDLVGAAPAQVRRWMQMKARLADGMPIGLVLVRAESVLRASSGLPEEDDVRTRATTGLLRMVCGCSLEETAARVGVSRSSAHRRSTEFESALREDAEFASLAAGVLHEALLEDFPDRPGVSSRLVSGGASLAALP